eukprot:SAG25_NODE_367_length_9118_cov_54.828578_2_plen_212_part_00
MIDDLGFDDLGFRNSGQIQTPHFDQLAHSGILLDSYYVQPSCSPTRATIMTGEPPSLVGLAEIYYISEVSYHTYKYGDQNSGLAEIYLRWLPGPPGAFAACCGSLAGRSKPEICGLEQNPPGCCGGRRVLRRAAKPARRIPVGTQSPLTCFVMTGRKPVRTGINVWIPTAAYGLPLNETTLAQVLNRRGFISESGGPTGSPCQFVYGCGWR